MRLIFLAVVSVHRNSDVLRADDYYKLVEFNLFCMQTNVNKAAYYPI